MDKDSKMQIVPTLNLRGNCREAINHMAWKVYLRKHAKEVVSPYAVPAMKFNTHFEHALEHCFTINCNVEWSY